MKKSRWISLLLVLCLSLSLTGCIGNFYENVGTVDGRLISSGLYLNLQYDAYNEGNALLEENRDPAEIEAADSEIDPFDEELEELAFEDWVVQETEQNLREFVAVERLSAENEVVLSEEGRSYLEQMAAYWEFSSEIYAENGISYDTVMRTLTNNLLKDELFLFYYGPEGELSPSDEEIQTTYEEQFGRIEYISLPFNTTTEPIEDKETEVMAVAEEMLARLEDGDSFEEVAEDGVTQVYEITGRELVEESVTNAISTSALEFAGEEDDEYYPPEFRSHLQEMEEGDFGIHAMDSLILVYRRVPTFEDAETFEAERSTVVRELYQEDFDAFLAETYENYPLEFNFGARSYFSPKKIV